MNYTKFRHRGAKPIRTDDGLSQVPKKETAFVDLALAVFPTKPSQFTPLDDHVHFDASRMMKNASL